MGVASLVSVVGRGMAVAPCLCLCVDTIAKLNLSLELCPLRGSAVNFCLRFLLFV